MTAFIIISTLISAFLGLIWNSGASWFNFVIKFMLLVMAFWGGYLIFTQHLL